MSNEKKTLGQKIYRIQEVFLCLVRKWWRPITAMGIAGAMFVNGIIMPLITMETDLMGLSALVTAAAGAFAVREWGKVKGVDGDGQ